MAARKKFKAKRNTRPKNDADKYAAFMAELLAGTIAPTKLVETRPDGDLELEYEDGS